MVKGLDSDGWGQVAYDCKHCKRHHWEHPGGRCLYTPHPYDPSREGIGRHIVGRDLWIFERAWRRIEANDLTSLIQWGGTEGWESAAKDKFIAAFSNYDTTKAFT